MARNTTSGRWLGALKIAGVAASAVGVVCLLALHVGVAADAAAAHRGAVAHTQALPPERVSPRPAAAADTASTADWWRYAQVAVFAQAVAALPPAPPSAPPEIAPPPPADENAAAPAEDQAPPPAPAPAPPPEPKQVVAPPPPPPPPAPAVAAGLDTSPMDPMSRTLFDDTNRRRASAGLPPLRPNGNLVGVARIRSQDMASHDYFAHTSPITGDTAFSLMDRYGVPYGWAGENLAKNNYPDSQCVGVADDALWNSPPHRENILNPHYTDAGIALVIDGNGVKYFTIVFSGPA